jgi:GT2 family glycosyltransferase
MLHDCLSAVAAQTRAPDRVLVMDNGSHDDSIEQINRKFPFVEIHALGKNHGFARANNLAVEIVADCDWIALLNPDAFPRKDWLEELLNGAARYPDCASFASCMISHGRNHELDGAGDSYRVDGVAWPRYQGAPLSTAHLTVEEVFSASGGACLLRRDAFLDAGQFDERYFCYHEDVDLGFRLRLRGWRCLFLPNAVVWHVGSAIAGKGSEFSVYHAHRNNVWTYAKDMPSPHLWMYLPSHLAMNLASVGTLLLKGRGAAVLRAKWDALRGLPSILRSRREVQMSRRIPAETVISAMQQGGLTGSLLKRLRNWIRRQLRHQHN